MTEQNSQIRIKDIASRANVSIGTVDRVLHNRGEVSEKTRRKVLKIIKELNYHPNILASTLASKKTVLFATLFPQPPSPEGYWNKPLKGVVMRIAELQQYGVATQNFTFSQTDAADFEKQANAVLDVNPDGVVLAPFYIRESRRLVGMLIERKIPFIFIDSELKNAGQLSYVGQDSFQSGLLSGKLLGTITPAGGAIWVIHFAKEMDNQNHLIQRELGFYEWFRQNQPERAVRTLEIPNTDCCDWEKTIDAEFLNQEPGGIFVTNSKVFLMAEYLQKNNISGIRLIGHDLLEKNRNFLESNHVDFLICQRPEEQGYSAINKLFQYVILKKQVEKENYTPIDIVTKENVNYYKDFN
ncbi:MAG: substrate-binding domain-containing protein [Bacteroidota bacterium]